MKKGLKSHWFHTSVVILVIIDCAVLTAELIIDHISDTLKESQNKSKTSAISNIHHHSDSNNTTDVAKYLDIHHDDHASGFGSWAPFFHTLEEIFKYTSLVILTIFVIEIILKLIFIPKTFKKPLEIFDAFIVVISFGLNLYLFNKKHHIHSITGIITMLR